MRLLDAEALIYYNVARLVEFTDASEAPDYAILSHTWEDEEVLFEDIKLGLQHEIASDTVFRQSFRSTAPRSRSISLIGSPSTLRSSSLDYKSIKSDEEERGAPPHDSDSQSNYAMTIESDEDEPDFLSQDSNSDSHSEDPSSTFSNTSDTGLVGLHVKAGWNKVLNTCLLAVRDRLRYVWIDTCRYITVDV